MTEQAFSQRMIMVALLGVVVVVGILAGYNPFEVLLSKDETRTPGTWKSAPLATPPKAHNIEDEHIRPQAFPDSQSRDIELE